MVVIELQYSGRASPSSMEEEEVLEREREAPKAWVRLPSVPPLYIASPGGAPALEIQSPKGAAAKGGGVPPKASGAPPTLGFPTLGAWGGPRGAHQTTMGWFPSPLQPLGPSGMGGPTRWTPGTLSVVPVQYRVTPKLSRWPKQHFLYIILYLRTIPELLVTSGISSGTPNNIRYAAYSYSYNPSVTEP